MTAGSPAKRWAKQAIIRGARRERQPKRRVSRPLRQQADRSALALRAKANLPTHRPVWFPRRDASSIARD
jgi:hypothetical protein